MTAQPTSVPRQRDPELIDALALLLEYPQEGHDQRVQNCVRHLESRSSPAVPLLENFRQALGEFSVDERQEQYTRTFDHNEDCALEIGWHVYGETYQRGVFMAQMRDLLRKTGVPESSELPDHMSHVLQAAVRTPEPEGSRLVRITVMRALRQITKGLQSRQSPYQFLLLAIQEVLVPGATRGDSDE